MTDLEGVNITFWRENEEVVKKIPVGKGKAPAKQPADPLRRNHKPVYSDLTDASGDAVYFIDKSGSPFQRESTFKSGLYASYETASGAVIYASDSGSDANYTTSKVNFLPRPAGVAAPQLIPSSPNATAGEFINVTFIATTYDGNVARDADVTFFISAPKGVRLPVQSTPTKSARATGASQALDKALQHTGRFQFGADVAQFPAKTNDLGEATLPVTYLFGGTVVVSAAFSVNEYEIGTVAPINLQFAPPPGVSSISLKPDSQTVRPGR